MSCSYKFLVLVPLPLWLYIAYLVNKEKSESTMSYFETWLDLYSSDHWKDLMNIEIINLLDSSTDQCVSNIISNDSCSNFRSVSEEPILIHYFTQIGGTLLMKEPRVVAPNGFFKIPNFKRIWNLILEQITETCWCFPHSSQPVFCISDPSLQVP